MHNFGYNLVTLRALMLCMNRHLGWSALANEPTLYPTFRLALEDQLRPPTSSAAPGHVIGRVVYYLGKTTYGIVGTNGQTRRKAGTQRHGSEAGR